MYERENVWCYISPRDLLPSNRVIDYERKKVIDYERNRVIDYERNRVIDCERNTDFRCEVLFFLDDELHAFQI